MNPKRTAILWFAGGLTAIAIVLALAVAGVVPLLGPRETVALAGGAGVVSAFLGERLHLVARVPR